MAYRLCLQLGCEHPDILLDRLTAEQLKGWRAYYEMEPFGADRLDYGFAMVAHLLYSGFGGKPRRSIDDFIPQFDRPRERDPKQIAAVFRAAKQIFDRENRNHGKHRRPDSQPRRADG
jgi:hypothetical protein